MKKEWKHPFWENYQKDRITAKLVITHDDGKVTSSTARIGKFTPDGKISKDWQDIIDQNSIETIEKNTEDRKESHRKRHEAEKIKHKENVQKIKLEELFNLKLEIMEIDSVKNCSDRKLKSRIRKAKSKIEAIAFANLIIQQEYLNEQSEEQS